MNLVKKQIKSFVGSSFKKLFTALPQRNDLRLIFMYHRIVEKPPVGLHDPAMFVTSETLAMHIQEVSQYFDIVPLDSIASSPITKKGLCAITFDDGWVDNYDFAFPVLRKYNVPATIFIPVGMIDSCRSFWFQDLQDLASQLNLHGKGKDFIRYFSNYVPLWRHQGIGQEQIIDLTDKLKSLPPAMLDDIVLQAYEKFTIKQPLTSYIMNWDQIHEMSKQGIAFGSHGLHHYILPQLDDSAKRQEVIGSLDVLQHADVSSSSFFSYPNGNWDDETRSLVVKAGYKGAVTTQLGHNVASTNPYLLKRIAIHEEISNTAPLLWFRILQAAISRDTH
jgi:peptidoglycan/xylan/chitin deacetylase (PgdA/CDA1 family)